MKDNKVKSKPHTQGESVKQELLKYKNTKKKKKKKKERKSSMQAIGASTSKRVSGLGGKRAAKLSFYPLPPTRDLSLDEFETFAIDRLKGKFDLYLQAYYMNLWLTFIYMMLFVEIRAVLRMIQALRERGVKGIEFRREVNKIDDKLLPIRIGNDDDKAKDNASHYILRLAYCQKRRSAKVVFLPGVCPFLLRASKVQMMMRSTRSCKKMALITSQSAVMKGNA